VDEHKTICTVDIAGYGGMDRTRTNYVTMRAGMYAAVQQAFAESGIPWEESFRQDVGDSILALVPGEIPKGAFAGPLPEALRAALCAYNETHPPEEQVRLRLALDAGEIRFDDYGVASKSIILANRLLDAKPLKEMLSSTQATLAMIASDWFYTHVIKHADEYAWDSYRRVTVEVKETKDVGWIRVPGHELPADSTAPAMRDDAPVVLGKPITVSILPSPSSAEFFRVVAALEQIQCIKSDELRPMVVEQLRFAGTIRHFSARRAHVISILRTCFDFENGVVELIQAIANLEGDESIPLRRLVSLLIDGV
jgi:Effector-associated domain 2